MKAILAVLVLGQALDALTFTLFHRLAPAAFLESPYERNVIVANLLAIGGVALVAAVKVGVSGLTFATFTGLVRFPDLGVGRSLGRFVPLFVRRIHERTTLYRLALRNIMLVVATGSGFVGAAFNLRAIGIVLR